MPTRYANAARCPQPADALDDGVANFRTSTGGIKKRDLCCAQGIPVITLRP